MVLASGVMFFVLNELWAKAKLFKTKNGHSFHIKPPLLFPQFFFENAKEAENAL